MGSKVTLLAICLISGLAHAGLPGDKRTILTSGDKVYPIHYQLGQSTILYFGMKPETVICGNKNYFAIEKIKEGITIQPLGSFSTNLTVMSHGKRFLFYLTPASGRSIDTFIDVRWVPEQDAKLVATAGNGSNQTVRELNLRIRVGILDFKLLREIKMGAAKRMIFEFEIKNTGINTIQTSEVEIFAQKAGQSAGHQIQIFEKDDFKPGSSVRGRLILSIADLKNGSLVINHRGRVGKIQIKGDLH